MSPFLFVFAMLLSQMLIAARGNVEDPFMFLLHKSQIVEDGSTSLVSRGEIASSSSLSSNSPDSQITASLPKNSSVSIERSGVIAENESMLDCDNITIKTANFLLNFKYSRILSHLNSSFYVKDGDLLTVCKDPWLEKMNQFFTVLAEVFASLVVLLVNIMMPNSFYHGRSGLIVLFFMLFLFTSSWFGLSDGSAEYLWSVLHTFAGVANIIAMSIYTWVNIFTSSIVLNYLNTVRYIRIKEYSDNQYSIHILDESFITTTGWFVGIVLCGLTYLMSATKFLESIFGHMSGVLLDDKVIIYLIPIYFLMILTWFFIYVTNKLFLCPKIGDFRRKVKLLQESFNVLLLMSIATYTLALYLTDLRRDGPNWLYNGAASIVAVGTLSGFYFLRKFRNSSEFDYEANAGQQQEDFIYMFRVFFDVDKICLFGFTAFDCKIAEQRYEEETGEKSSMRASWKQILHELGV